MSATLLPPNATGLSLALEAMMAADVRLGGVDGITGAKLDVLPSYIPWLLWEYGLGELLPYLPDPRAAIRDGVAWQRLRGTPQGLATALGWVGFNDAVVEEAGPGPSFAAVQLDPGTVPSREEARRIVGVAGLALPARAQLVRLYHGYDLRPLTLSGSVPLGEGMLDDDSGVDLDGVRQSYGLYHRSLIAGVVPEPVVAAATSGWAGMAVYTDRPLLDQWAFGEPVVRNYGIAVAELVTMATAGLGDDSGRIGPPYMIPRAALVASESVLGDVNASLGAYGMIEEGEPLVASGAAGLSNYALRAVRTRFDEVFIVTQGTAPAIVPPAVPTLGQLARHAAIAAAMPLETVLDGEPIERVNHRVGVSQSWGTTGGPYEAPWPLTPWSAHPWGTAVYPSRWWVSDVATRLTATVDPAASLAITGASTALARLLDDPLVSPTMMWSGASLTPEAVPFWAFVPWDGNTDDHRPVRAGGGGFGGWACRLLPMPRLGLAAALYPSWPDSGPIPAEDAPAVRLAVTTTGA